MAIASCLTVAHTYASQLFIEVDAPTGSLIATPGSTLALTLNVRNASDEPTDGLLAANLFVSIAPSTNARPDGLVIGEASLTNDAVLPSPPLRIEMTDGVLLSMGALPPTPPPILAAGEIRGVVTLEIQAAPEAMGDYMLLLAPSGPGGSQFLSGPPPVQREFSNLPLSDSEPGSLLVTVRVVPEPGALILAAVSLLGWSSIVTQRLSPGTRGSCRER